VNLKQQKAFHALKLTLAEALAVKVCTCAKQQYMHQSTMFDSVQKILLNFTIRNIHAEFFTMIVLSVIGYAATTTTSNV
jgi:hypothetical protein